MKRTFAAAIAAALVLYAAPADAQVIDFEDRPDDVEVIPDGYEGFNWSNFYSVSRDYWPNSGYNNAMVGNRAALNGFAEGATLSSPNSFIFQSALIGAAWNNGLTVTVRGLFNGVQLFSEALVVNAAGSTLFNFGWGGINELQFTSAGGTNAGLDGNGEHFVIDNMAFGDMQVVPEPITMVLLGTGLVGVGAMRRRRRQEPLA